MYSGGVVPESKFEAALWSKGIFHQVTEPKSTGPSGCMYSGGMMSSGASKFCFTSSSRSTRRGFPAKVEKDAYGESP